MLGRTGTGKSALLAMLQKRLQRVVSLDPAKLSLSYVSNAPILKVLREAGVNLEFFYKLLWRHCFCVELLRLRFPNQGTFANLADRLTSKDSRRALDYLKKYGDTFFEQSDVRTQTLVKTVEEKVGAEVGATFAGASAKVMSGGQLTLEERSEIARKAQTVLPEQLRQELADILELVATVLDDEQKPQYVLVDRIDENWVAEEAKLPLIMALVETMHGKPTLSCARRCVATNGAPPLSFSGLSFAACRFQTNSPRDVSIRTARRNAALYTADTDREASRRCLTHPAEFNSRASRPSAICRSRASGKTKGHRYQVGPRWNTRYAERRRPEAARARSSATSEYALREPFPPTSNARRRATAAVFARCSSSSSSVGSPSFVVTFTVRPPRLTIVCARSRWTREVRASATK